MIRWGGSAERRSETGVIDLATRSEILNKDGAPSQALLSFYAPMQPSRELKGN